MIRENDASYRHQRRCQNLESDKFRKSDFMEPFGFPHLYIKPPSPWTAPRSSKLPNAQPKQSSEKGVTSWSLSQFYYPVNAPICDYQRRLMLDAIFNNVLIALPQQLDASFIACVIMLNFARWFPDKKVVYIGLAIEDIKKMSVTFAELTGSTKDDICVYGISKKKDRFSDWQRSTIVFSTAEALLSDARSFELGSEVCLIVADAAHRAANGSHPLSELVRVFILNKGSFRVLALTDIIITKVAPLQQIVMNLQIGKVRSIARLKNEVYSVVSSCLMNEVYVPINNDMQLVAIALVKIMTGWVSLLHESGVVSSDSLQRISNHSNTWLRKRVEKKAPHLHELLYDLEGLFRIYDALMCDGITAFAVAAQKEIGRSSNISNVFETNMIMKEAVLKPDMPGYQLESHKITAMVDAIQRSIRSQGRLLSVVILFRDRGDLFIDAMAKAFKKQFSSAGVQNVNFVLRARGTSNLSERIIKKGSYNVILCPCDSTPIALSIGFIDLLISADESLSTMYYTDGLQLSDDAQLYAFRSSNYETNVCQLASSEECIPTSTLQGIQLCTDNPTVYPNSDPPNILEYWAENKDEDGLLSTLDKLELEERLATDGGGAATYENVIKNKRDLLRQSMAEALIWQDRLQPTRNVGHSTKTLLLSRIMRQSHIEILPYEPPSELQTMKEHLTDPTPVPPIQNRNVNPIEPPKTKRKQRRVVPPPLRIQSASFPPFNKYSPSMDRKCLINRVCQGAQFEERQKQLAFVVDQLRALIRL